MALKNLLNAIHDTARWVAHIVLIPLVAALKAINSGIAHLVTEIEKV